MALQRPLFFRSANEMLITTDNSSNVRMVTIGYHFTCTVRIYYVIFTALTAACLTKMTDERFAASIHSSFAVVLVSIKQQ